ncbi:MAG TPA: hypothetical protein VHE53_04635 [Patescibacteria group bacterium]|nr:hypothetical protein [Patescibacteria group bacterium]
MYKKIFLLIILFIFGLFLSQKVFAQEDGFTPQAAPTTTNTAPNVGPEQTGGGAASSGNHVGDVSGGCTGACAQARDAAAAQGRPFLPSTDCGVNVCTLLACSNGIALQTFTYYPTPDCPIVQTSDDSYYDCPTPPPPQKPTATPVPPTATPTKTPPACGVPCNSKAECAGAKDGCNYCNNNGVCSTQPTPTPTNAPTATPTPVQACNSACVRDADCQTGTAVKDGCVACINGFCKVPPTPTATPIPFNPAACKCDGIEYSSIVSGGTSQITSYGKVMGADTSKAKIVSQKFFLAEGAETTATIIGQSDPIAAKIVSQAPDLVRYSSVWNVNIPQLKSGATYRIWSQIDCEPAANAMAYHSSNVLGAVTESSNPGFFGSILNFFSGLFGGKKVASPTPTPIPASSVSHIQESTSPTPGSNGSLQLQTIQPVEVYQKTCSFIKFRYTGL